MNNYFSRLMRAARFPTKYSEKIAFVGDLVRAGLFFEDRDRYLALLDFPDVDEWFAS